MKNLMLIIACIVFFNVSAYCGQRAVITVVDSQYDTAESETWDTTLIMFGDSSYQLAISMKQEGRYYDLVNRDTVWNDNNGTLTLYKITEGKKKIMLYDSLDFYEDFKFAFKDYNNDMIKDLLLYHMQGATSNEYYYLYLVDQKNKKLIRIKGFEDIPNPEYDEASNLIESVGLSARDYLNDYRITSKHTVIQVGKTLDVGPIEDKPKPGKKSKHKKYPKK